MNTNNTFSLRIILLFLGAIALLLVLCTGAAIAVVIFRYPSVNPVDVQEAKSDVERLVAELQLSEDSISVLHIVTEDFDDSQHTEWGERVCAYARRYIIVGSALTEDEIVQKYAGQLESVGFRRKGSQYAHTATLYRGSREMADVHSFTGFEWYAHDDQFARYKQENATVMQVYLQTVVPGRKACGQWTIDEEGAPYAVPTVTPRP